MPDDVISGAGRAEKEPGGIQCIVIEESIFLLDGALHCRIHRGIPADRNGKQDMMARSCGPAVFGEHIVAAGQDDMVYICKDFFQCIRRIPGFWILAVVIVTVHGNHIGFQKIIDIAVAVQVICKDMVKGCRRSQVFWDLDCCLMRVDTVLGVSAAVGTIQC